MTEAFEPPIFDYVPPPEVRGTARHTYPVAIVGAGPIGLCAAIDLAQRGVACVVLDDDRTVSVGSRAICWAQRTLDILDRYGVAARMMAKGVTWQTGKVFFDTETLYQFDLAAETDQKHPAFINLQQYYAEAYLVDRIADFDTIDLRWCNRVTAVAPSDESVDLTVETPDGTYTLSASYVIAADGARSVVRSALGLDFEGQVFDDRFLIADVRMEADFPPQRWFWFDPPFNRGQSALLHMQADDIWRIDLQLGPDADPELDRQPDRVIPRLQRMLGPDASFDLVWTSVYTFQCRRLRKFRHGRVLLAGDAAHQVSPFGARGANSGIQDVDNLVWKLALVIAGQASDSLLESYDAERRPAADENIRHSSRATDFITPKNAASRALRDATLDLARTWPFARSLVNSGRLSTASTYDETPLNGPDTANRTALPLGTPCPNIALGEDKWLLDRLGNGFTGLYFPAAAGQLSDNERTAMQMLSNDPVPITTIAVGADASTTPDPDGGLATALGVDAGGYCLLRPDQHLQARFMSFDPSKIRATVRQSTGQ